MVQKSYHDQIFVRRLYPTDQEDICNHFRRLDVVSRRARFFGSISDDRMEEYARNIFRHDSIVCGAFLDRRLRGIVELRGVLHFLPSRTEAAFSVEPDWQVIGIGDALIERIIAVAQNRGVGSIKLICLRENARMRHLAAKHSARLEFDRDVVEATLQLRWPTPASLAIEIIGETKAFAHSYSP